MKTSYKIPLVPTVIALVLSAVMGASPSIAQEPKDYDRLDGKGATQKRVDVIEWENNLEIHVYPKGSLRGLGLKIDRTKKDKPVMVVAYRFNSVTYTLIRRAILSIPISDNFKVFEETNTDDYDKIIISNNTLASNVKPYKLDAAPTQLYPDHHPMLAEKAEPNSAPSAAKTAQKPEQGDMSTRTVSSQKAKIQLQQAQQGNSETDPDAPSFGKKPEKAPVDEDGGIKSFQF